MPLAKNPDIFPEYLRRKPINELRISKAKLLLRTEKYSLEEISAMVGYASYKTFRRIFVKLTGVTPGKYGGRQSDNSLEE